MASKLMVVIGVVEDEDHIKRVVKCVESGVEKWISSLDSQEAFEIIRELNGIPVKEKIEEKRDEDSTGISRFRSQLLDTTLLINPTCETLHYELLDLFLGGSSRCFITYSGFISEENADWCMQDGLFSFTDFKQIIKDPKISSALSETNCKVTVNCCKLGSWEVIEENLKALTADLSASINIMDSLKLHTAVEEGGNQLSPTKSTPEQKQTSMIEDFSDYLEDNIGNEVGGIFNTLKPPLQEGFLKIRNPCLYIFPAGHGDSAFFAVNGFNMLVNGGASTKPWFWKLIQHVDRVDSILATHLGSDNLPGLNSLLLRKLQERQVKLPMDNTTPEYQKLRQCLVSPDLGPLFINAPAKFMEGIVKPNASKNHHTNGTNGSSLPGPKDDGKHPVLKTVDIVKDTFRLSKALHLDLVPLVRKPGSNAEPVTLFSKVGLGRLEMYVISPAESSKELAYINEKWGCNGKTTTPTGKTGVLNGEGGEGDSSVTNLSSICCLLVWHPSNPNERIVRVLFPGNATQTKIFEGLENLKNLPFLKAQFVTKNTINKQKNAIKTNGSHPPSRNARPVGSATAVAKKPPTAGPKKTAAMAHTAPPKKETVSAGSKHTEKRPKPGEKFGTPKARPTQSASTSKGFAKASNKGGKLDAGVEKAASTAKSSSSTSVKKSAASRPTSSATAARPAAKSEVKRAPSAQAKPATSKTRQTSAPKSHEKPKKPVTLAPAKAKAESRKSPSRPGPSSKTADRKSPTKTTSTSKSVTKISSEKTTKKQKPESVAVIATPPEDLSNEFVEDTTDKVAAFSEKSQEPVSTGSEEPSHSTLSDRHSPEGEDVPSLGFTETPPATDQKADEKADHDSEAVDQAQEIEKNDSSFVITTKPEISEESDFISENGSSVDAPHREEAIQEAIVPKTEEKTEMQQEDAGLISSDASSPTQDEVPNMERKISFVEPENRTTEDLDRETSGAQPGGVERLPTPFHSLQESSGTTDNSPLSEFNEVTPPADIERDTVYVQEEEDGVASPDVVQELEHGLTQDNYDAAQVQEDFEEMGVHMQQDAPEQELSTGQVADEEEEDMPEQESSTGEVAHEEEEVAVDPIVGGDVHNSFNSSMEGSYELYPVGRSPPPASDRQETIAETISEFKDDETPITKEYEDISANLNTQQQQADLLEDQTMSTEAPDPRFSISTTSTGSRMARMDSPFSPSEIGLSATSDQASPPVPRPDPASTQVDDNASENPVTDAVAFVDDMIQIESSIDTSQIEEDIEKQEEPEQEPFTADLINIENEVENEEAKQPESMLTTDSEDIAKTDENYTGEEQTPEDGLDNYPQHAWAGNGVEIDHQLDVEQKLDLHANQPQDYFNGLGESRANGVYEQNETLDNMQYRSADTDQQYGDSNVNDNERNVQMYQEEEDRMQMTGSLASSAQDQGPECDYSETTSLTETGATPDVEKPPMNFEYDGPDLREYEQVEGDVISKSDLSLSSPEENFPLHGGFSSGAVQDQAELNGSQQEMPVNIEEKAESDDLKIAPFAKPRYHPAYVDPIAPLADPEEGQGEFEAQKSGEGDSFLDVNATPFVPKSSVPMDPSPTYASEAQFRSEDGFPSGDSYVPASPSSPIGGMNPFMADLISNVASLDVDPNQDARLPPVRGPDPCAAQDSGKTSKVNPKKTGAGTSRKAATTAAAPIFVDLTYVPNHANKNSVGIDFFKRIRAKYYVISGSDQSRGEPSAEVLDHLLEGKKTWFSDPGPLSSDSDDTNITVIPTHDTTTVREWYQQNFKKLESCNIHMVASGSKVLMQDESIEACKIEF